MPQPKPTLQEVVSAASRPERESPFVCEKRTRTLELTELRLPLQALPSGEGRGRTFEARMVPPRTIELVEALLMTQTRRA